AGNGLVAQLADSIAGPAFDDLEPFDLCRLLAPQSGLAPKYHAIEHILPRFVGIPLPFFRRPCPGEVRDAVVDVVLHLLQGNERVEQVLREGLRHSRWGMWA